MFPLRTIPFRIIFMLLSACGITVSALTQLNAQPQSDPSISFNIAAQPLDDALAQYFRSTGVQLLYDSRITVGHRSAAVRGSYSPREALRLLLQGTGLVVRYSRASSAIIARPDTALASPLVPLGRVVVREHIITRLAPADRLTYYQQMEDELQARLRADRRTLHLSFAITVQLTVNPDGRVDNLSIKRGSGDSRIDRTLLDILTHAAVTPPPPGLEQPLAIALKGIRH